MSEANDWENAIALDLVQALLGNVSPTMRAISFTPDEGAQEITLYLAVTERTALDDELVEEMILDFEALRGGSVGVTVRWWVGTDLREWPGFPGRYVYSAYVPDGDAEPD